jgi:hypothetical protein
VRPLLCRPMRSQSKWCNRPGGRVVVVGQRLPKRKPPAMRPEVPRFRRRGRDPDRGRQGQPLRPPRRDDDPAHLPARPEGGRGLRPPMGSGRLQRRRPARPPGQELIHPIQGDELRGLRRLQRERPSSPVVFVSERGSLFTTAGFARMIEARRRKRPPGAEGPPAHASPRLRIRPSKQRLHGADAEPVQGLLAGLTPTE